MQCGSDDSYINGCVCETQRIVLCCVVLFCGVVVLKGPSEHRSADKSALIELSSIRMVITSIIAEVVGVEKTSELRSKQSKRFSNDFSGGESALNYSMIVVGL